MDLLHELWHAFLHTLTDVLPALPFLYLSYLLLELLERRVVNSERAIAALRTSRLGPLCGGVLGALPQCGTSIMAAGLYAGRVVSLGTLLAVFLSTSDEMLPVLVAGRLPFLFILLLVLLKAAIGILVGFLADLIHRRRAPAAEATPDSEVEELCRREGCHCDEHGIFAAALYHFARVALFLFAVSFILTAGIHLLGEDKLGGLVIGIPGISHLLAGLVGLIPNCAASVVLTELYLHGALSLGTLFAGLLPGAGVGLLVLFRANRTRLRECLLILLLLLAVGVGAGLLLDALGIEGLFLSITGGAA